MKNNCVNLAVADKLDFTASDQMNTKTGCFLGQRHIVTLIGFMCCFLVNSSRLVFSVGIVAMVKHEQKNETLNQNASEESCPLPSTQPKSVIGSHLKGDFDWSSELQGYLLGAGFLSYLLTQTAAGRLADAIGSKCLLVFSLSVAGLLVIISPIAARWHVNALLAVQFLRGASQGITTPAIYKMMSNWIPKTERGTLNTLAVCGYSVGIAVPGVVTGWLCDAPGLGWQSAFYVWGAISVIVATVIYFIYYEHPVNNPWITEKECKYIIDGLETKVSKKRPPTPWRKIFSSVPTYAYFYGLFGHYWAIMYFITVHPTFMGVILHYSSFQNGLTSCLPVLITTVSGVLSSMISHFVSKKKLIGLNKLRKVTTGVSALGFSLAMAGILLTGCDAIINIFCFAVSLFSYGIGLSGIMIAGVDMAPAFAGSVMGVATNIASMASILIPVTTGLLTTHQTLFEWHKVFWINLGIVGSSGLVYVLFGSAEVQPWNYPDNKNSTEFSNEAKRLPDKNLTQLTESDNMIEIHKI